MYVIQHTIQETSRVENKLVSNTLDNGGKSASRVIGPFSTAEGVLNYMKQYDSHFNGENATHILNALAVMLGNDYNKDNDTLYIECDSVLSEEFIMDFEHYNEDTENMESIEHTRKVNHSFRVSILQPK